MALAIRLAYAWHEINVIPRQALQAVPFLYEPGDIAYSIAVGRGFGSPFRVDTGPTAFTTPVYPLLVAGVFEIFGTFNFHAFLATIGLNILFSTLTCVPIFYAGKRIAGISRGSGRGLDVGHFPERRHHPVPVGLGHLPFRIAGRDDLMGDTCGRGLKARARLVRVRNPVGRRR